MKRILAVLLTIALVVAICGFFTACEEELPTAEEVVEKLVAAQEEIKSYEMEIGMSMKMVMDIPEEEVSFGTPTDVDVQMDITGVVDDENEEIMMGFDMDMSAPGEDPMKMEMEMYLVDGWMYAMMDMPLMDPQWVKSEMSYEEFMHQMQDMDFAESQIEFLKSGDAVVTGREKVKGIDCYVLEVTPDMDKLWELMMQQSELTGGDMLQDLPFEKIGDMIKDFSVKYWIAKDTYYMVRGDIVMDLEITPEAMGVFDEEGSVAMDMSISMLMFNHNESVSISLPTEAEDAVEQSMW